MNHEEQRKWLIRNLLDEDTYYKNYRIPEGEQEQKDLLRSLMNVRKTKKISQEFLKIQDEFYKIYETGDMERLEHFNKQLDIIAEGYRAQSIS